MAEGLRQASSLLCIEARMTPGSAHPTIALFSV